jgi:yecA family protein
LSNQKPSNELSYENFTAMLKQHNIIVDASEVQGILCGMLGGGMNIDDQEWIQALADMINQGDEIPPFVQGQIELMFNKICQEFIEADFALQLCLPSDLSSINIRGAAFVNWVHGFLLGFGLHQNDLTGCSAETKEALEDLSDIAKLEDAMEENEESEQAFFEVIEYVRISAMLCFNELGKSLIDSRQQSPTVH